MKNKLPKKTAYSTLKDREIAHPKRIHTPHDKLFKQMLKDVEVARDFFDIHLPKDLKPYCDLSTLQLSDTSYVEPAYQANLSDVLYRLNIKGNPGYLYCVIEHVSEAATMVPFQILRYQISILQQHYIQLPKRERRKAKLPLVVPLLFYRGKKSPYPYSTDVMDCFFDPELAREIFLKLIPLIDLSIISDEELKTHKSIALLELVQKHIHTRNYLNVRKRCIEWVKQLEEWITQDKLHQLTPLHCFEMMIKYICAMTPHEGMQDLMNVIEQTDIEPEYKDTMQTMTEYLTEKGMQAGIYQANQKTAKKMLSMGFDYTVIREATGLAEKEIEQLKKDLN